MGTVPRKEWIQKRDLRRCARVELMGQSGMHVVGHVAARIPRGPSARIDRVVSPQGTMVLDPLSSVDAHLRVGVAMQTGSH